MRFRDENAGTHYINKLNGECLEDRGLHKINLGTIKALNLKREFVNKLFGEMPTITIQDKNKQPALDMLHQNSEIVLGYRQLASMLFQYGSALMSYVPANFTDDPSYVIKFLYKHMIVLDGIKPILIYASENYVDWKDDKLDAVNDVYEFYFHNKQVIVRKGDYVRSADTREWAFEALLEQVHIYPDKFTEIPAVLIPLNEEYKDMFSYYQVYELINEINRQSSWNGDEFNISGKSNVLYEQAGNNQDRVKKQREFNKYNSIPAMTIDDTDSPQGILPTQVQTLGIQALNIKFLQDELVSGIMMLRETTSTGTNKFNSEIMMYNQKALEDLMSTANLISLYLNKFYQLLFGKSTKVKINLSRVEQVKITTMENNAKNLVTQNRKVQQVNTSAPKGNSNDKDSK